MFKKVFNLFNNQDDCEKMSNKVFEIDENCTDEQYASARAVYLALDDIAQQMNKFINGMENIWEYTSNKTDTIDENSTNKQYAGAKAVFEAIQNAINKD